MTAASLKGKEHPADKRKSNPVPASPNYATGLASGGWLFLGGAARVAESCLDRSGRCRNPLTSRRGLLLAARRFSSRGEIDRSAIVWIAFANNKGRKPGDGEGRIHKGTQQ